MVIILHERLHHAKRSFIGAHDITLNTILNVQAFQNNSINLIFGLLHCIIKVIADATGDLALHRLDRLWLEPR